jgi:thiol-disulfide isomerase/thioredoxin
VDGRAPVRYVFSMRSLVCAAIAAAVITAGCGGVPSDAQKTVISMAELDSLAGATRLARGVAAEDGVYAVYFDKGRVELVIVASPRVDALKIATSHRDPDASYALVEGAGHGSYKRWEELVPDADVKILNKDGEDIADITTSLAPGKVTIVDFSAAWCAPCRLLDAYVTERLKSRKDLAYRKIDVADWGSPVAEHYMSGVNALPFVIVFGKDGKEVDRIVGVDSDRLERAIDDGAQSPAPPSAPAPPGSG